MRVPAVGLVHRPFRSTNRERAGLVVRAGASIRLVISHGRENGLNHLTRLRPPHSTRALCNVCLAAIFLTFAPDICARHELFVLAAHSPRPPGRIALAPPPNVDSLQWIFSILRRLQPLPSKPVEHALQQWIDNFPATNAGASPRQERGIGTHSITDRLLRSRRERKRPK